MAPINWDDILAGGLGAGNEVLFGAPEWLIKQLGGREKLERYINAHKKAHDIGSTVGLVGSAFIPVGGIAKTAIGAGVKGARAGAGALRAAGAAGEAGRALELAKAADIASDVGRAGKLAEGAALAAKASGAKDILKFAERGAALGAAEQGARGFFAEEKPEDIAKQAQAGLLFGGLGGAAGGALSKFAPQLARLSKKATEKATLGLTDVKNRELLSAVQRLSGEGSGPMAQVRKVDDIRNELANLIKRKKLWKEGAVEAAATEQKKIWAQLDDAYERVVGGQKGAEVLRGALKESDIAAFSEKYDPEVIKTAMDKLMGPVANRSGLANIRGKLEDMAKYARSGKEESAEVANAIYDISKTIRGNLDEAVIKTAEASGIKLPPNFKREYGLLLPIARGEVRAEIAPTRFNLGSPTFEKAAAATLLGGGSTLLGGPNEDIGEKAKRAALGAALGFGGSKLISAGLRKGIASADTLAEIVEKAAPKIAEAPKAAAAFAGRGAANTERAIAAAAPETEREAEAAKDGADLGQASREDYMSLVLAKLTEYAQGNGIEPDSEDFNDFIQTVGASTMGDGGPFDARSLAGLFYPDPAEREAFTRALDVSRGLASNLPTALKSAGGFAGIGESPEVKIEKTAALDKLAEIVGQAAKESGGTEAAAKKMLAAILNSRTTQTEKRRMIQAMMENYGVDFGTLGRVGLSV